MSILYVFITSIVSFAELFLLTKLMGNRQIKELTTFDYIIGISIGSIAAEMATELDKDFYKPMIAMAIYAVVAWLISIITQKNIKLRRFFSSKPVVIYSENEFHKDCFKKTKIDINDFLMECRINGFFDLNDIDTAILEANGEISILPKATAMPATPDDLKISSTQKTICINVALDGKILSENLVAAGINEKKLLAEIKTQGLTLSEILLATCDMNGCISCFKYDETKENNSIFE